MTKFRYISLTFRPHVDDDLDFACACACATRGNGIFMLWCKYSRVTSHVSICTVYRTSCVYTYTVDHFCLYGDVSKHIIF